MRPSGLTATDTALLRIERKHLVIKECDLPSHPVRLKEPLQQILIATRHIWDIPDTRESVRKNFRKVIDCRTAALGGEIYASDKETLVVPHTCKSRSCPSCGHRATLLWQRDRWCDLFDVPYSMVTLTMPDVLWRIFSRQSRPSS
jgi:Transposase zinc-binding domain